MSQNATITEPRAMSAKEALLAKWMRGQRTVAASAPEPAIPRREDRSSAPLSYAQRALWFFHQLDTGSPLYNIPVGAEFHGELDLPALQNALNEIVVRHEVLRTRIIVQAGSPQQVIDPPSPVVMRVVDLSNKSEGEREAEGKRLTEAEVKRPFNLTADLMIRALVLRLEKQKWQVITVMDHIASDLLSWHVLGRELGVIYQASLSGGAASLRPLAIQYADFADWEAKRMADGVYKDNLVYWRKQLADAPPLLELPADHPRPARQSFRGKSIYLTFPNELTAQLRAFSQREGVSLFMLLLAGFQTLVHRCTGQDDIVLGSPMADRSRVELEPLVGFFVNTLVLRNSLAGNPTFRELLGRVRLTVLDAVTHREIPFEKLVEDLRPERSSSRSPIVQIIFAHHAMAADSLQLPGLSATPLDLDTDTAKFDLTLSVLEKGGTLHCRAEYNSDLFEPTTIQRLLLHYQKLLQEIVANPGQRLAEIPLLTAEDEKQLSDWDGIQVDLPQKIEAPDSSIVKIQPSGLRAPLFLIHGAGGGLLWGYANMSKYFPSNQPLYAFESRGMRGLEEFGSIEEMARRYILELKQVQPEGPYCLGGYCFGGNVAYEMACQLRAGGDTVAFLGLIDSSVPNGSFERIPWWQPAYLPRFARNTGYWLSHFLHLERAERDGLISRKIYALKKEVTRQLRRHSISKQHYDLKEFIDVAQFPEHELKLWQKHLLACSQYKPRPYSGRVTLFRTRGQPLLCSLDPKYGWGELAAEVQVQIVPGAHEKIFREPHVKILAEEIERSLRESQREPRRAEAGQNKITVNVQEPMSLIKKSNTPEVDHPAPDQLKKLLAQWNDTSMDYQRGRCLHQLIEEQAARTPEAVALIVGAERFTYRDLNGRANRVAHHLRSIGVKPESLVAICMERSLDMVVGLLAVLKSGGAYVPLDPVYPRERLEFILEDAKAAVLLTQKHLVPGLPTHQAQVVCLDTLDTTGQSEKNPASGVAAENLAYVIFTSGSTGRPKGVAIEHRSTVAFTEWARTVFTAQDFSGVMFSTSICFDLSVFELFVTLSCGGKVILADNALQLSSLPCMSEVTLINTVPSAIAGLLRLGPLPSTVRIVNLAGEPLAQSLVEKIYQNSSVEKVYDLYGPSEDTTYSTFILRTRGGIANIGRPIANTQAYILNDQRQPVAIGEAGELFLGGEGLARGYLYRPELTAEKFVANPFSAEPNAKMYRTGDLTRFLPDGNIEYLGRLDHQVKIRGFRIELGEIEAVLESVSGIDQAVVMAREETGEKRLVAYVVGNGQGTVSTHTLRNAIRTKLPEYMMPSAFVILEKMPLTPNGKVDRKALPIPDNAAAVDEKAFVAPQTAQEKQVAKIWCEVLGLKQAGLHDNFFDLGGHSLLAIQVISRVREEFSRELTMADLFKTPTVAGQAAALGQLSETKNSGIIPGADRTGSLPLSFIQQQLWFLQQLRPESAAYNVPMAVRLTGPVNIAALRQSLHAIVQRQEVLRATFPSVDGHPRQVLAPADSVTLTQIDLQNAMDREEKAQKILRDETNRPFDLARGPLLRVTLVWLATEEHLLMVVMHHIISDGWSQGVFFRELGKFYEEFSLGIMASLPELPVQYADFAHWQQHAWPEQEVSYWKNKLDGAPAQLVLPKDHSVVAESAARAGQKTLALPENLMASLQALGRRESVTPFISLLTGLTIALHQWSRQNEFVVGTVSAGRNRREFEPLIGCFMNFLPLRLSFSSEDTALDVLNRVKRDALEAQAHQDCPFEKIVQVIKPERKGNENPLYNVAFLLQNYPKNLLGTNLLKAEPLPVETPEALLDLRFIAEETDGQMALTCEYREALFKPGTIEALLEFIDRTLAALASDPHKKISRYELPKALPQPAKQIQQENEKTCLAIAATFTVEPLEESLRFWTEKLNIPATISFAPYNQIFQQLLDPASLLGANRRGLNVVLVRLEDWLKTESANVQRHADELVDALKAAASRSATPYVVCLCPPSQAASRQPAQIELFQRIENEMAAQLAGLRSISIVRSAEWVALYPVADYDDPQSNELAHIPYTPACYTALGTFIARKFHTQNRAPFKVIALDCDQTLWSGICGEDGAGGIVLDAPRLALQKFMRAQLDAGMLLCLCTKNNEADVASVFSTRKEMPLQSDHFVARRVNWLPKSENLKSLAAELGVGLDSFIFVDDNAMECAEVAAHCPEVLTLLLPKPEQIAKFLDHCWAFDHENITEEDQQRTAAYRQNRQREQFQAETGGLAEFIAGLHLKLQIAEPTPEQLPRLAQLTQRTNQFNCTSRRRTENDLRQLQHDGHQLRAISVSDRFGDYGLVGAMIFRPAAKTITVDTFLLSCRVLGKGVEHQMIAELGRLAAKTGADTVNVEFEPSAKNQPALDFLEKVGSAFRCQNSFKFPADTAAQLKFNPARETIGHRAPESTTSSKPISRAASSLYSWIAQDSSSPAIIQAAIESDAKTTAGKQGVYLAPRTDLEKQLCRIWEQLLRVKRVGIHDDFFDLGGHSMLAVRLFAQIGKLTGKNLPLVTLFQSPTIEQLAAALQQNGPDDSLLVPLQPEGTKPPLFLIHGAGGGILWGYANLARHLGADQPVYGLESRGMRGMEEFETVEAMAAYYIKQLRKVQPEGPYYLGGYCFGGSVAYEMARQLHAQGDEIAFLALIDAAAPNGSYNRVPWWRPSYLPRFVKNTYYWLADFVDLQPEERRDFYQRKARSLKKKMGLASSNGETNGHYRDLEGFINVALFPEHELKLWQVHLRADRNYRPQPYSGGATLFRTRGQPLFSSLDPSHGWNELVGDGVGIELVQGAHEQIFMEPSVQRLAVQIKTCLNRVQARKTSHESTPALV